ncbi:UDP-2,4-diacetamido-2,4,6-trideoxy-beta-L-altropyranose hydrolase [Cohnella algarum]|uniref:UDP-2,4-diacetamido-2,4, 6-trideoxy-beta-L-altropyranose hydrolase n=1 Tax=Cohnella algarum TaxID=2044859 RepID=UPI001966F7B7|nr:UDP-2,4-diacetamido-2,4,6-trideoxy-beta-L-altropyranose hydrolase [Cohnella algarum]MBN2980604.1 UDP-2,4-diacetamido-2,4,6-trideoxy-beta-L-altropyranose hydrolase [Cohnella algarum]
MTKIAVFRTDASSLIGSGHVMRCLALADSLRVNGFESIFVCRRLQGHLCEYIRNKGYDVEWIDSNDDEFRPESDAIMTKEILARVASPIAWLIIDHYGIDRNWEIQMGSLANRILVIDDLANRPHLCDILVDQNAYERMESRYKDLLPPQCLQLLGPGYLLLRPSFYEARKSLRARDGSLRRLLVFFGGSDPTNETAKALRALARRADDEPSFHTDVVIGSANPYRGEVTAMCAERPYAKLHVQAENMAELIASADFALGAGGVAMWERCYLGLPSAVTVVADNQAASVRCAAQTGAVAYLGESAETNADTYARAIEKALESPSELLEMSKRALEITESRADRTESPVASAMLEMDRRG